MLRNIEKLKRLWVNIFVVNNSLAKLRIIAYWNKKLILLIIHPSHVLRFHALSKMIHNTLRTIIEVLQGRNAGANSPAITSKA